MIFENLHIATLGLQSLLKAIWLTSSQSLVMHAFENVREALDLARVGACMYRQNN